jgi:hypothetical protein
MSDNLISEEVTRFVHRNLPSINHLNALIRLAAADGAVVSAGALADALRTSIDDARAVLGDLVRSDVASGTAEEAWIDPADTERASGAATIADANARFPVQLIRAIYERPPSAVQSFADAFRVRKNPNE